MSRPRTDQAHPNCVVVLAKEPRPGRVKTRLAATLGENTAAELCEAFLRDTLDHLPRGGDTRAAICFSPPEARDYFSALAPEAKLFPQSNGTFGERLQLGFQQLFEDGHERVVFIGGDTPHLEREGIEGALEALEWNDVVLGPCTDGGYYLIGLRAEAPELFRDVPWSTPQVLEVTLERATALGLRVHCLAESFDVDDAAGLQVLQEHLGGQPALCPQTAERLAQL